MDEDNRGNNFFAGSPPPSENSNDSMESEEEFHEPSEMEMDRERLYNLREESLELLNRYFDDIVNEEILQTLSKSDLRVRQTRIQKHFGDFEAADRLYRQTNILVSNQLYMQVEAKLLHMLSIIEEKLSIGNDTIGNRFASSFIGETPGQVIRLETTREPQLGEFYGEQADWPAFRDLFLAEVDKRDFDPVKKLLYLQRACKGRAALALGPWTPIGENYKTAWETLVRTYDDKYHVVHSIIGRMMTVKNS